MVAEPPVIGVRLQTASIAWSIGNCADKVIEIGLKKLHAIDAVCIAGSSSDGDIASNSKNRVVGRRGEIDRRRGGVDYFESDITDLAIDSIHGDLVGDPGSGGETDLCGSTKHR